MGTSAQSVEELLASGVDIPDDPAEIEKLLAGMEPDSGDKAATVAEEAAATKAAAEKEAAEATAAAEKAEAEKLKAATAEAEKAKGVVSPSVPTEGDPSVVLHATRESLHMTEEALAERDTDLAAERQKTADLETRLRAAQTTTEKTQEQLQAEADKASKGTVDLATITPEKIEALRTTLDDDAVEVLAGLAQSNAALVKELDDIKAQALKLAQREDNDIRDQQQADIDSAPLLAVLQAQRGPEADARWGRAVQYQDALRNDPDWTDKSQREMYVEVSRRMEAHLGEAVVKTLLTDKVPVKEVEEPDKPAAVAEVVAAAEVPGSLSDIPTAGNAVAQDEKERAEAMSLTDVDRVLSAAADKGPDEVNKTLARLMSND